MWKGGLEVPAKFLIKDTGSEEFEISIIDKEGLELIRSINFVSSEKEARQIIAKIRKAINRFTKVEVEK